MLSTIPRGFVFPGKKVFFTSDTHFFHGRVIAHVNRPFSSMDEMNEKIIRNWNKVVPKDGIVFHLGDFGMAKEDELGAILDQLKGTIYLVAGNHDEDILGKAIAKRFSGIEHEMIITVSNQKIVLNHFPLLCFGGRHTSAWQLFGHIHTHAAGSRIISEKQMAMLEPNQYDVGVDNNNFTPISFERVKKIIERQQETGERFKCWENTI